MNKNFNFPRSIDIDKKSFDASQIIEKLQDQISPDRFEKLKEIITQRNFNATFVLENIYDEGNISAVIRSIENYGIVDIDVIESEKSKISTRTTRGAHKWVEMEKFVASEDCFKDLKERGKTIVATTLSATSYSYEDLDYSQDLAIIFGNEKDGVSEMAKEYADHHCLIPTVGFSQSFNISVAAALFAQKTFQKRIELFGQNGHLSEEQQETLLAHYLLRSIKNYRRRPWAIREILEG